jgi:8-oxo-dGTP pyrophosphatase MutT (NUDIX family)
MELVVSLRLNEVTEYAGRRIQRKAPSAQEIRHMTKRTALVEQAGGIVVWGDKLILHRTDKRNLVFPKGHVEAGESTVEAAVREVEEETGLIAEPIECAGTAEFAEGDKIRRVTYFVMQACRETPEWSEHCGIDTFPVPLDWADSLLKHQQTRAILAQVLPRLERLAHVGKRPKQSAGRKAALTGAPLLGLS